MIYNLGQGFIQGGDWDPPKVQFNYAHFFCDLLQPLKWISCFLMHLVLKLLLMLRVKIDWLKYFIKLAFFHLWVST